MDTTEQGYRTSQSREERHGLEQVKVKAVKRGTIATRFGTFHFDPKGKDKLARERTVRSEVAIQAKEKGLVTFVGRGSERTAGGLRGRHVAEAAASRRETSAEDEHEQMTELFGAGGADTRDTTAFERDPSKFARTGTLTVERTDGTHDGTVDEDEIDGHGDDSEKEEESEAEDGDDEKHDDSMLGSAADGTLGQEGNAGGGDAPPRDDAATAQGGTAGQDGQGLGSSETGDKDTQDAEDSAGEGGGVADEAAAPPGPKPRRTRPQS